MAVDVSGCTLPVTSKKIVAHKGPEKSGSQEEKTMFATPVMLCLGPTVPCKGPLLNRTCPQWLPFLSILQR